MAPEPTFSDACSQNAERGSIYKQIKQAHANFLVYFVMTAAISII